MKLFTELSMKPCLVVMSILLTTSASAVQWECGERSNLPQEGKNYCAAGDFRQSELNMRTVFDAVSTKHKISFDDASALSAAQSAFEFYRDNHCIAKNKRIEDKSYHPMLVAQCKTRLTTLRIDELNRLHEANR